MTDDVRIEPSGARTEQAIQIVEARRHRNFAPAIERAQAGTVTDVHDNGFPAYRALVDRGQGVDDGLEREAVVAVATDAALADRTRQGRLWPLQPFPPRCNGEWLLLR